jgi:hypothetical protein
MRGSSFLNQYALALVSATGPADAPDCRQPHVDRCRGQQARLEVLPVSQRSTTMRLSASLGSEQYHIMNWLIAWLYDLRD